MSESRELKTLRYMAIERAIGELRAALQTFWDESPHYDTVKELIEKIITDLKDTI